MAGSQKDSEAQNIWKKDGNEVQIVACKGWSECCDYCDKRFNDWVKVDEDVYDKIPEEPGFAIIAIKNKNTKEVASLLLNKTNIQKKTISELDRIKHQVSNKKSKATKSEMLVRWTVIKKTDDNDNSILCAHCQNYGVLPKFVTKWPGDILSQDDRNQLLVQIQSQKIHKNLRKSVKLFSYWTRNIEIYINNSQRLDRLKKELYIKQELTKPQTRGSTHEETKHSLVKKLSEKIDKFNRSEYQSLVIKRFFEVCKAKNKLTCLCLDYFKDITEETINGISDTIKTELVKPQRKTKTGNNSSSDNNTSKVTLRVFQNNIKLLTSDIKSYQDAIKSDIAINTEVESIEKELKEVKSQMKQIEDFQLNIDSNNDDSTNFVVAEIGFLVEVQAERDDEPHIEYYHFPVTFPNKNTFSIYDLQNEEFNYFSVKNKRLCYGNYIVDDVIIKNTTRNGRRSQADPSNDYHSESVLFFLCQQRSFQEKMINKLIKCLQKNDLKLTKLEKLILEIHSTNDICTQCFKKAEYLINWKEEHAKLTQEKKGDHFLEYFRKLFSKMLKKDKVLDEKSVLDLKVEIRFSYDEDYGKASTESNPCIIRFKNDDDNLLDSDTVLSKYSIITSGGVGNVHDNYSYAYNKAVEPARIHAKKVIKRFFESLG